MASTKEPGITKIEGVKGTSYRVQIRIKNGEHLSKNFSSFEEAKSWKRITIAAVKSGAPHETSQMRRVTIGELIDRYIESELQRSRNHKTMLGHLKWFKQEIGHITLNHFREEVVAKCRDKLANSSDKYGRPRSASTVNRYLCTLGSVVSIAIREWRLLSSSPLKSVRKLAEPRGRTRFLTKEDRERLLLACKESQCPHLYPITLLALLTGMRRGEILGLKWKDIDLNQRRLTLHRTKNGDRRVLPLIGPLLEMLMSLKKLRKEDKNEDVYLFPGRSGKEPINFRKSWNIALDKARIIDFHFHDTRHDFISVMAELGYPLHVISMIVGHRSHSITATRYSHLNLDHAQEALGRIGNTLSNFYSCHL